MEVVDNFSIINYNKHKCNKVVTYEIFSTYFCDHYGEMRERYGKKDVEESFQGMFFGFFAVGDLCASSLDGAGN